MSKPADESTGRKAETPAEIRPAMLQTWPESEDHEFGGLAIAPPEVMADMLSTFADVFHRVHDLRVRLEALPRVGEDRTGQRHRRMHPSSRRESDLHRRRLDF